MKHFVRVSCKQLQKLQIHTSLSSSWSHVVTPLVMFKNSFLLFKCYSLNTVVQQRPHHVSSDHSKRLKTMKNNQTVRPVKWLYMWSLMRRWLFTRGSDYRDLTGEILVFWKFGRLWEVVAYKR